MEKQDKHIVKRITHLNNFTRGRKVLKVSTAVANNAINLKETGVTRAYYPILKRRLTCLSHFCKNHQ